MIEVTMQEIEANVLQLIQKAIAGEDVVILSNNLPVVKLSAIEATNGGHKTHIVDGEKRPLVFGAAKSFLIHLADDFDEPVEDFAEYM